jgi:glutamate dehydrogenase
MIVPVGAKGGFVPMTLPETGDRDEVMREGTACYKLFINGLLDITDNLVEEKIVPPTRVVRRDPDDPYLVVAADKGTATFSDTANAIAQDRGFWMGDAFASGGSVGYDHKGMGITAKGAWEGVKRHFRELGTDIQREPFSVVGIGDMSGDVFGNGMLLSRQIRLRAAFNHLHIFLDPDPDPVTSFRERQRLFALPRSGWGDYDAGLISEGGGVYSRQDKAIPLSRQVRAWLGIEERELTPDALIRALLTAEVDLLWNGGIGTYVKASRESNADVGDLANNAVRVNGGDLRCRVIGEGGNLGLTQLGRVEFAQAGGRVNTDFIDNSAGVDCSDHEVNIKLLLDQALRAGALKPRHRDRLLADMTDEVEALVLRSNYLQTQALSMMEHLSAQRIGAKQRFINILEDEGQLDRDLEFLPSDDELLERRNRGEGLYRPELAVLLSYSKIRLYQQLLASDVPEDPFLSTELARYFPKPLQERFGSFIPDHRLRREIVATQVTNSLINRMGISFVIRMRDDTGATPDKLARAYTVARELLGARDFWERIEALDNKVPAKLQTDAMLVMWEQLRQVTRWLANLPGHQLGIQAAIDRLRPGLDQLQKGHYGRLDDTERAAADAVQARLVDGGVPARLARRIALLPMVFPMLDVVETAAASGLDVMQVASVYRGLGESLGLKWLRARVEALRVEGQWHAQARGNLRDELYGHHRELVNAAIRSCGIDGDPVACWIGKHHDDVARVIEMMEDIRNVDRVDYAIASVAVRSLGQLVSAAS